MNGPRILVVRFSAIGDCTMVAWAATALREKFPNAFMAWAVESRCLPVIDDSILIDQVVEVPRERWKKERRLLAPLRLFAGMRKLNFDVGFDFQGHSKTAICLRLARPKVRIAARGTDAFARSINPLMKGSPKSEHEMDLNYTLVREFTEIHEPERPMMPNLDDERSYFRDLIRSPGRLVTIQTGAGAADKVVPTGHWSLVARGLMAEGLRVVAIGAPGDPRIEEEGVQNLVGALSLRQAMAAVAESVLHVAGDTGSGHIAAALGVPALSVFGPTPPERYHPWSDHAKVLRHPSGATDKVAPDEILAQALRMVDSNGRGV